MSSSSNCNNYCQIITEDGERCHNCAFIKIDLLENRKIFGVKMPREINICKTHLRLMILIGYQKLFPVVFKFLLDKISQPIMEQSIEKYEKDITNLENNNYPLKVYIEPILNKFFNKITEEIVDYNKTPKIMCRKHFSNNVKLLMQELNSNTNDKIKTVRDVLKYAYINTINIYPDCKKYLH